MKAVIVDAVVMCRRGQEFPQLGSKGPWGKLAGSIVSLGNEESEVGSALEENDGGRSAKYPIRAWGGRASMNKNCVLYCRKSDAGGFLLVSDDQDGEGVHISRHEERQVRGVNRDAAGGVCSSPY
jgi:hypothetical protein